VTIHYLFIYSNPVYYYIRTVSLFHQTNLEHYLYFSKKLALFFGFFYNESDLVLMSLDNYIYRLIIHSINDDWNFYYLM